jgi:peptide/nickel transport system permease protein
MTSFIIKRLVLVIPTLLGILTASFIMLQLIPGDSAIALAGDKASPEKIEEIRKAHGLDRPLIVQYGYYIESAATLDFGRSLRTGQPVTRELRQFFGATIELSIAALIIALIVGIPLGVLAATRQHSPYDYGSMVFALVGLSTPVYWAGIVLIYLLSFRAGLFPIAGIIDSDIQLKHITYGYVTDSVLTGNWPAFTSSLHHLALPAIVLATIPMAIIARMTRSSMLEVLGQDYLRTASAKGLSRNVMIVRHALKNALIPVVTIIGLQFGALISGAFLTETVFARPGVGRYVVSAIGARDYPVIQAVVLTVAILFVLLNLIVDILYAFLDPRIHYG